MRRVVIEQQLVIRIPVQPRSSEPLQWEMRKGPKCLPADALAGATLSGPNSIDFLINDGRRLSRVRAVMNESCPALDFYGGFYVQPQDQRICREREQMRSRAGTGCTVYRFYELVPRRR